MRLTNRIRRLERETVADGTSYRVVVSAYAARLDVPRGASRCLKPKECFPTGPDSVC